MLPVRPFADIRLRARTFLGALARENATPARLAAACVVGGMVGATPLFGLHVFLCVALAIVLRLNKVVVYAAANISVPPFVPLLAAACIEVGSLLLTGRAAVVDVETLRHASPWTLGEHMFVAWMAGAPIVGGLVGGVLGIAVYSVAIRRGGSSADTAFGLARAEADVRARFRSAPPRVRHYVTWKLRLDPAYRVVAEGLPAGGHVVDLGAGLGLLPVLLALLDPSRRVTAIDWDAEKVSYGRAATTGLAVTLEVADMRSFEVPLCDAIVLLDVLHYVDVDSQRAILRRAVAAVRSGGIVFVREADRASRAGRWTRSLEALAIRFRWNRGAQPPSFRALAEICTDLEALGVDTTTGAASATLYPGNGMIRGRKRAPRTVMPSERTESSSEGG